VGESRLGEKARSKLIHLLSEDHPEPEAWLARLRALRDTEGGPIFSDAVRALFHLEMDDGEAERLLRHVLDHRIALTSRLGRDAGMRVAAMDYLTNVERRLLNPKIVEMEAYEATERSARTDPLTSLANRRVFDEVLDREIRRSRRYRWPLTVLFLDLDRFKDVNDAWGHLLGDLVLERIGDILRRTVREADIACRFGGEEFAVVLPETARLGGYAVAERIRRRVEEAFSGAPVGGHAIPMTVSCGLACFPDDGLHASEIVSRADEALYGAKRAGRNRVGVRYRDKRAAMRFPVKPEIAVEGRRRAVNLSRTGILLATDTAPAPAEELHVGLAGLEAAARVVRVERGQDAHAPFLVGAAFEAPLDDAAVAPRVLTHAARRPARGARGR
jgi:diguanylate cyclase (GGDEF)-like protein